MFQILFYLRCTLCIMPSFFFLFSFFYRIRVSLGVTQRLGYVNSSRSVFASEIYPELWIGSSTRKDPPWFTRSKVFLPFFRGKFPLQRFYFVLGFLHSFLLNDLFFRVGLLLRVTVLISSSRYAQLSTTCPIFLLYPGFFFFPLISLRLGYIRCQSSCAWISRVI